MEGEWPLVGRAGELERVAALVRRGVAGVVLAGPAGVGKTRLAAECVALAQASGFVPLRVPATQAAAALPFGAYAPLLPDLTGGLDRTEMLRQIGRAVLARGEGKPVALLVDDAHLLDEGSALLTHQLAAMSEALVVATVRSGEPASDAVVALWKDGLAERFELQPLSSAVIEQLLAAVLGGPADGAVVRRFSERSEGNVLFLRELVLAALDTGVLREDGGLWRLHGPLPASGRLVELVEARLAGLSDDDRKVLEVVAVGEPLGLAVLDGAVGRTGVGGLERRALVRLDVDDRRLQVRLAHPLYGDVVRARLSPLRARTISRGLADALEGSGLRRREDALRMAAWRLDGGGQLQLEVALAAAEQARALCDFNLGERFTRAAIEAGGGFAAHLLLSRLLSDGGRSQEAETLLASLVPTAATDAERSLLAANRMVNFLYKMGRLDAALAVADEAERSIVDRARRDEITAERMAMLEAGGKTDEAVAFAGPFLERASGRGLIRAARGATFAYGTAGRLADAVAVSERGLAAHIALEGATRWTARQHLATRVPALAYAGCLREAETLADEEYELAVREGWAEPEAWFAHDRAIVYLHQGRIDSALRWSREAMGLYRAQANYLLGRWALMLEALALALLGRDAEGVLAELEVWPVRSYRRAEWGRARAWAAVVGGDAKTAKAILEEAGVAAAASGEFTLECAVLHDIARLGHPAQVAPRLAELAEVVEGPLAPARSAHTAALLARDPAALEQVSRTFEGMPALLFAAEAAADAAVAWRRAGDPRKAAAAEQRAHALADRCEGARTPALAAVSARAALTARELEIARLAAAGVPNKEIAERLFLSLHTVQNKLHSAYEKLGIEGRSQLGEALDGH